MENMRHDISEYSNCQFVLSAELSDTRRKVADLLLHINDIKAPLRHLSQSDIATTLGTSWDMVNSSLISLKQEGALKIDRHKLAINKNVLERILIKKD
jgi:DNA-binding GntR family transcriptional regulator